MKTPTPIGINAAAFLDATEKDKSTIEEPKYIIEGGPGQFMLIPVNGADTINEAIAAAKEDKKDFGFEFIQVRDSKTNKVVYTN